MKKEDKIDNLAGIVLEKKIGSKIEKGEILAYIHTNKENVIQKAKEDIILAYKIQDEKPEEYVEILDII